MPDFNGLMAKGPPETPFFIFILRIIALVLSVAVFVAACYNASTLDRIELYDQDEAGPCGLGIFTSIWTWIVMGVGIFFSLKLPHLYLRIVFWILEIVTVIFWLCTWCVAASAAATALDTKGNIVFKQYGGSAAAIAGLGAVIWVILIVTLIFWSVAATRGSPGTAQTELGAIKTEGAPTAAAAAAAATGHPQQHPQQYPQQQYPQNGTPYTPAEHQGAPQQYPPQQGTPQPYGQQPYPPHDQQPYTNPSSPPPGQNTPYPPGEYPQGYPQEPHHQSPQQPQVPYPQ